MASDAAAFAAAALVVLAVVLVAAAAAARRPGEKYTATPADDARNRKIRALLGRLGARLRAGGIPFWATGGTVLGAIRHGDQIPWDDDADIAVWARDLPRVRRAAESAGARWRRHWRCFSAVGPAGETVDVFPMRPAAGGRVVFANPLARARWPREYFFRDEVDNRELRRYGDVTVPLAANPCRYLSEVFPGWDGEGLVIRHDAPRGGAGPVRERVPFDPRRSRARCHVPPPRRAPAPPGLRPRARRV